MEEPKMVRIFICALCGASFLFCAAVILGVLTE